MKKTVKKLFLCVVALILVFLSTSKSLSASPECPLSCLEARQHCSNFCEGCPYEYSSCLYYSGCFYVGCTCRPDLC
jgi:hypothetical protein